jgi:hypothetical protein
MLGGEQDISKELRMWRNTEKRQRIDPKWPALIYEYNQTDHIIKIPQRITAGHYYSTYTLGCSEEVVKCAVKIGESSRSPRDYLKEIEDSSPFQLNTEPKYVEKMSLQVQFLDGLRSKQREMSAVVFTDLPKGVAFLLALLNELPSNKLLGIELLSNEWQNNSFTSLQIASQVFGKTIRVIKQGLYCVIDN